MSLLPGEGALGGRCWFPGLLLPQFYVTCFHCCISLADQGTSLASCGGSGKGHTLDCSTPFEVDAMGVWPSFALVLQVLQFLLL